MTFIKVNQINDFSPTYICVEKIESVKESGFGSQIICVTNCYFVKESVQEVERESKVFAGG